MVDFEVTQRFSTPEDALEAAVREHPELAAPSASVYTRASAGDSDVQYEYRDRDVHHRWEIYRDGDAWVIGAWAGSCD